MGLAPTPSGAAYKAPDAGEESRDSSVSRNAARLVFKLTQRLIAARVLFQRRRSATAPASIQCLRCPWQRERARTRSVARPGELAPEPWRAVRLAAVEHVRRTHLVAFMVHGEAPALEYVGGDAAPRARDGAR